MRTLGTPLGWRRVADRRRRPGRKRRTRLPGIRLGRHARERLLTPDRDVGIDRRRQDRGRCWHGTRAGCRRQRRQRLRRHPRIGKPRISRRRKGLRPFPVGAVGLRAAVGRRGDGWSYRWKILLGSLPDDSAPHPLPDRDRDQEHHGAYSEQNRRQSRRGLHWPPLYPRQRPDDVELGRAGSPIAGLAD
jgi:hypothetical protein